VQPPEIQVVFLPPSPEQATAGQDQAGKASTGGEAGNRRGVATLHFKVINKDSYSV
jgi:hypothetical protein